MELKIDSEKVLSAAVKCPQAKEVFKELFPEIFPTHYERGQWFQHSDSMDPYVLCIINKGWFLVNIRYGTTYSPESSLTIDEAFGDVGKKYLKPISMKDYLGGKI